MHLVVGLGNPGRRYAWTRHNAGVLVVERLGRRWSIPTTAEHYGSQVGNGAIGHERVILALPQSFMNRSGAPVASLLGYYKRPVQDLIVVHDDLDLPFGAVRVKRGGGHRGHNGLRDIIQHVGADFNRVRVGIGRPPDGWDPADFVLGRWTDQERAALDDVIDLAADAVEAILNDGVDAAVSQFQRSPVRGVAHRSQHNPGRP